MYLSYSGFDTHEKCPSMYCHRYVDKTRLPVPENKVRSLYGSTVGVLFELFYSRRLWSSPKTVIHRLIEMAPSILDEVISKEEDKGGRVDFSEGDYKSKEALLEDVLAAIPRGIHTIRHHRLLSDDAAAEVPLNRRVGRHMLGGRADFIMSLAVPEKTKVIIDGKGSRYRDKYCQELQLMWYSMLYREGQGHLPDKVGFLYWRCEAETALDWVTFTDSQVDNLRDSVLQATDQLERKVHTLAVVSDPREKVKERDRLFFPTPGNKCTLCSYRSVCDVGQRYLKAATEAVPVFMEEEI